MITVLVPVYNEGSKISENLGNITASMKRLAGDFELLVVDDGSTDGTPSLIQSFAKSDRRVRVVIHKKNAGIGAALRTGIAAARGNLIFSLDSDMTYSAENLPSMLDAMKKSGADMVIGTPYLKRQDRAEIPFVRYVFSRGGNLIDQLLFGLNFTTPTCFFRLWKTSSAKKTPILFDRFEGVPESSIRAFKLGYKIIEVPAKYNMKRRKKDAALDIMAGARGTMTHLKMLASLLTFRPKRVSPS